MAVAAAGGEVRLDGARLDHIEAVVRLLETADIRMREADGGILVRRSTGRIDGVDVMTEPYPGFPTDMQAQIMALMTIADGAAMITETIFENRFMHVPELMRLGANINVQGPSALVRGSSGWPGASDGDRFARFGVAGHRRAYRRGGDGHQRRSSSRSRLRAARGKAPVCGARIERVCGGT